MYTVWVLWNHIIIVHEPIRAKEKFTITNQKFNFGTGDAPFDEFI